MTVKSIKFSLDFRSGTPIYLQIMDQIRQMVAKGELVQGDQLPTVRQLATDLRVNFNTVARAYRLLDQAGLISTQHGRGTYIWEEPTDETIHQLRQQSLDGLTRRFLHEAHRLGASPEDVLSIVDQSINYWKVNGDPPKPDLD
ncbi:MAG: GntR family transcriptional regulator [Anaerolineales bacterium]|nr:GntR family transcriptional regulator [Anaerolineales bacterium]